MRAGAVFVGPNDLGDWEHQELGLASDDFVGCLTRAQQHGASGWMRSDCRLAWIEALRAGQDRFDAAALAELREV